MRVIDKRELIDESQYSRPKSDIVRVVTCEAMCVGIRVIIRVVIRVGICGGIEIVNTLGEYVKKSVGAVGRNT